MRILTINLVHVAKKYDSGLVTECALGPRSVTWAGAEFLLYRAVRSFYYRAVHCPVIKTGAEFFYIGQSAAASSAEFFYIGQ